MKRWDALDVLRGLTIMLMLLNLSPGSWEHNYSWLTHARWEGWTLIDIVAPAFLFCVGAAMPLSLERRSDRGASRRRVLGHVLWRSLLLVAIGFSLNLYPTFDFETVRIPGVLQRIGLCYGLAGVFMLLTVRKLPDDAIRLQARPIAMAAGFILVSYWMLLYFVPVPGYGIEQRFDPVGSWPSVIDRAVIGVEHFFQHYRIDGQVVFDPEGILSTWPACFNVLLGALAGIAYARGHLQRPALSLVLAGGVLVIAGLGLQGIFPLIKNIWTSTFAMFTGGLCLVLLGLLMPVTQAPGVRPLLNPARIFGENPLLAYIICFLVAPLIDANWFGDATVTASVRNLGQAWFEYFMEPRAASLAFGLCGLAFIFAILLVCHRRRWILRL